MIALTRDERDLLAAGVDQWGGPAAPTDALAVALGVPDAAALVMRASSVHHALIGDSDVPDADLLFALLSTEITFASDRFGAGVEWEVVTDYRDSQTIALLRQIQIKLVGIER